MNRIAGDLTVSLLDAAVELMGRSGRGGAVRVQGDSMVPTLHAGQLLAVEFNPEGLKRGDLLLYRQERFLVVHRLLDRVRCTDGARRLRTRGDGLNGLDPLLDRANVVGRVLALRERDDWWDLRGRGARFYAACFAWHALFWAGLGQLAYAGDRWWRGGRKTTLRNRVWAADRWLLERAHGLTFRLFHRRTAEPPEARGAAAGPV
jgi:hypothetical protein